jgi:gas vesicle protein
MIRLFLIGMLCGVMITAAVTVVFAIPANSDYWRMEIYKRGGGAWTMDMKSGHTGWKWMVDPVPDTPSKKPVIAAPPSAVKVSERL